MNLVEQREKVGMTQQALSEAMNVDASTISKWESGAAVPRLDKIEQLSELLMCPIDELVRCFRKGQQGGDEQ